MKQFILTRYGLRQLADTNARDLADDISIYVQKQGGSFVIRRHCVEFFVPEEYALFVKLMYPFLVEV
jgi:hypothetical protein